MLEFNQNDETILAQTCDEVIDYSWPTDKIRRPEEAIALDIGACLGAFPIVWGESFKEIHCYEASAYNIERLHHNLFDRGITKAKVYHKAVADKDGEIVKLRPFQHHGLSDSTGNSILIWGEESGWFEDDEFEEVETISLPSILDSFDEIDLLKIDVEGAEHKILFKVNLYKVNYIMLELHNFLSDLGLQEELVKFLEETHNLIDGARLTGNVGHVNQAWERK